MARAEKALDAEVGGAASEADADLTEAKDAVEEAEAALAAAKADARRRPSRVPRLRRSRTQERAAAELADARVAAEEAEAELDEAQADLDEMSG